MQLLRTEAIVMKGRDLGEADRLLTLYTREKGKLRIVANGVRRTRSTMAALVQSFTYNSLTIYEGGSLPRLRGGDILATFPTMRANLTALATCSYMMELLDFLVGEEDPMESVFSLLIQTMQLMEEYGPEPLFLRSFELRLLTLLGYQPHLDDCIKCGQVLDTMGGPVFFAPGPGGLVCAGCGGQENEKKISPGAIKLMGHMLRNPQKKLVRIKIDDTLQEEVERIMEEYIVYRTERELKTLAFLRSLK